MYNTWNTRSMYYTSPTYNYQNKITKWNWHGGYKGNTRPSFNKEK